MPTYEFKCLSKACGHEFELLQGMHAPFPSCPLCLSETRRLISGGSFILKGDGWAKDGYSSKSQG